MAILRSYLLKATYTWLVDHNFTPYLLVNTNYQGVDVPSQYIDEDAKILLNISPKSIINFNCDDTKIEFLTTFNGEMISIIIPIKAVLQLYSSETNQGIYMQEFNNIKIKEGNSSTNPKKISKNIFNRLHLV